MFFWIAVGVCVPAPALFLIYFVRTGLTRHRPRSLTPDEMGGEGGTLEAQYEAIRAAQLPFLFFFILILLPCYFVLLNLLHYGHLCRLPPSEFLDVPPWISWFLPALLLATNTAIWPLSVRGERIADKREEGFNAAEQARMRTGNPWILFLVYVPVLTIVGCVPGAMAALLMNWHVRYSEDEIGVRRLGSFEERVYRYDQVREVVLSTHVSGGMRPKEERRHHLIFEDGSVLGGRDLSGCWPRRDERWIEFIRAKTGKPLRVVKFPSEVEEIAAGERP
jgi:hypothetical protein